MLVHIYASHRVLAKPVRISLMVLMMPGRFSTAVSGKVKPKPAGAMHNVDAATLAKARKLSVPVGLLAGVFGSFVGVGGGVLIVPLLTGACKALPQRWVVVHCVLCSCLNGQCCLLLQAKPASKS